MNKSKGFISTSKKNKKDLKLNQTKLNQQTNIDWFSFLDLDKSKAPKTNLKNHMFWFETKKVIRCKHIIFDQTHQDLHTSYQMGLAFATNYLCTILKKNRLSNAIELLKKFGIEEKTMVSVVKNKTIIKKQNDDYINSAIFDETQCVDSIDKAIKKIKK